MPEPCLRKDGVRSAEWGCGELADSFPPAVLDVRTRQAAALRSMLLHCTQHPTLKSALALR